MLLSVQHAEIKGKERKIMGVFNTQKFVYTNLKDVSLVSLDTKTHFERKGYQVKVMPQTNGCMLSISKGGAFKKAMGMQMALNIEITVFQNGIDVSAKVGIFGQQAIATAVSMLVAWPVLITQTVGMIQQSSLDDEAVNVIENAIHAHEKDSSQIIPTQAEIKPIEPDVKQLNSNTTGELPLFCSRCGTKFEGDAAFCPKCGNRRQ